MKKIALPAVPKRHGKNIYLVGFMATGKTVVGEALAKKKRWLFLDLDNLIEFREKRPISDIFAQFGEAYFRRVEKRVLKEVSKERNFVISCGGGIVLDKENIEVMKKTGRMICLTACADVIYKRTQGSSHRPLLNTVDPRKRIDDLLKLRKPFYAQADYTIDTSKLSPEKIVNKIINILKKK